jgi:hypothetical protein
MQFFFLATWKSAILTVTAAVAAVVSCCYGYNSFLWVNNADIFFLKQYFNKVLFELLSGFFGNVGNKIALAESPQIPLTVFTH